ncbi:MAG: hypothetical protein J5831_00940 [Bacteroidales bacterium]|nr:hypothetical protein [Bacteroidales bacterium]
MKKLVALFLCLTVVFSGYAKNDKDKNEFSINYGQATIPQMGYVMGGILGVAFTLGHFTFDNSKLLGAAGVEYVHYVNNWFGFGVAGLVDYMTADAYSVDGDGNKTPNGKYNFGYASVMPVLKFAWFNREHVGLYSKLGFGAGLAFRNGDSNPLENLSFSAQVTPIGVDFGGESFRGFVEAGVGMQGIVNAGVRWLF